MSIRIYDPTESLGRKTLLEFKPIYDKLEIHFIFSIVICS